MMMIVQIKAISCHSTIVIIAGENFTDLLFDDDIQQELDCETINEQLLVHTDVHEVEGTKLEKFIQQPAMLKRIHLF